MCNELQFRDSVGEGGKRDRQRERERERERERRTCGQTERQTDGRTNE